MSSVIQGMINGRRRWNLIVPLKLLIALLSPFGGALDFRCKQSRTYTRLHCYHCFISLLFIDSLIHESLSHWVIAPQPLPHPLHFGKRACNNRLDPKERVKCEFFVKATWQSKTKGNRRKCERLFITKQWMVTKGNCQGTSRGAFSDSSKCPIKPREVHVSHAFCKSRDDAPRAVPPFENLPLKYASSSNTVQRRP